MGYHDAARDYMIDAPFMMSQHANANEDEDEDDDENSTRVHHATVLPSHLRWNASPVEVPTDWSFKTPKHCDNSTYIESDGQYGEKQKIIVHYHMQHNAGTNFWAFAKKFAPCATRACWQDSKHCLTSYNEEREADNIRQNYKMHGVQYVSYEIMLPPRFPLPFVSESARRGLFFTTIVRDPFKVCVVTLIALLMFVYNFASIYVMNSLLLLE
jgi:hypothetical protein